MATPTEPNSKVATSVFDQTQERKKRKFRKSPNSKHYVSLELFSNNNTRPPHELAEEGNLEEIKAWCEVFGLTIKETDKKGSTLLHAASRANQVHVMQYLIENGINVDATDDEGNTALHIAVTNGHIEALHLLLNSEASDTILNRNHDGPLHIAMRLNMANVIAAFLEHPIELVVFGYRKQTPLHVIAEHDNLEACKVLHNSILLNAEYKKKGGFRLCAADEDNLTPIHLAARKGSHRVLDFMITMCKEHGYPTEAVLCYLDEENSTPLHAAVDGGHYEVVCVLLKHGADPGINRDDQPPPIHVACSQGKLGMVKAMVEERGKDLLQCRDQYQQTPLHRAVHSIKNAEVICYLLEHGAVIDATDIQGRSPLHQACIIGSGCAVEHLVVSGANPLLKDRLGLNAAHHSVEQNRRVILQYLLQLSCAHDLVYASCKIGQSPIHCALLKGSSELLSLLISAVRLQVNSCHKDSTGNNYLHLAAMSGDWKALSILLEHPDCQPLLNETNHNGGTPLHLASGHGQVRCVELLLSHGAMIHKCHFGHTPFMFACQRGHWECAKACFEAHPFQGGWTDDHGNTALHLSVESDCPMSIKLALDKGIPVTHNNNQESFLDIVIGKGATRMAEIVIKHDRWQECLDFVSPCHTHPMLSLIAHMPNIAKMVLDRCYTTAPDVNRDDINYWEKFDFKYIHLKSLRSDLTIDEADAKETTPEVHKSDGGNMYNVPDSVVSHKGSTRQLNAGINPTSLRPKSNPHLESLKMMVKYRRSRLLIHPIVTQFLRGKWRDYGRLFSIAHLLFFLAQVLFFSAYIIATPNVFERESAMANTTNNASAPTLFSPLDKTLRFITLICALINLTSWIVAGLGLGYSIFDFVQYISFWIDGFAIILTIIGMIPFNGIHSVIWEVVAMASFFNWFSIVLKLQLFDLFGVYVTMFLQITRTVFLVLLIFVLMIVAFALSFYVLAGNLVIFETFGNSLFINFGHLFGEIDYASALKESSQGRLRYSTLTFMLFIMLAILLAIVVQNLLIGLAVGDIEKIRLNSVIEKTSIEVGMFGRLDYIMPNRLLRRYERPSCILFPNAKVSLPRKVWRFWWRTVKGEDPTSSEVAGESADSASHHQQREFALLHQRLEEMALNQQKMMEVLMQQQLQLSQRESSELRAE